MGEKIILSPNELKYLDSKCKNQTKLNNPPPPKPAWISISRYTQGLNFRPK